jgi:hypothetical protein
MMANVAEPRVTDVLAVRSRVSWGAIAAGAMVALAIYVLLILLGVAVGFEVAVRGSDVSLGTPAAIYTLVALLLAMFFGGWATSRLAVGESKLEAVLFGVILWGVLFVGMIWLVSAGISAGFGAMLGLASGVYSTTEGAPDVDRIAADLRRAGVDDATVRKTRDYYDKVRTDPAALANDPEARQALGQASDYTRRASWWSLLGVALSMGAVILGSLTGSGAVLREVPILGVRRLDRTGAA